MENWKNIPGYEGLYQASSLGKIRSLDRSILSKNGVVKKLSGRILKPKTKADPYNIYMLSKSGKVKTFRGHRLVYAAFFGTPEPGKVVDHIDHDKKNDRVENLRTIGHIENTRRSTEIGKRPFAMPGEKNNTAKLTEKQVLEIRESNLSAKEVASKYNVSTPTIYNIRNRDTWGHLP